MNAPDSSALISTEQKSIDQLNLLTSIFQDFVSSLDIEVIMEQTTSLIRKHLDAEGLSLFLLDADSSELVCHVSASTPNIKGMRMGLDHGIVGRALREGRTQMVRDAATDPDFFNGIDIQSGATTRSILCAPLQVKEQKFGALEAINKNSPDGLFSNQDKELFTVLANAAALAIHNARMAKEQLEQQRIQRELELARKIQMALLPREDAAHMVYGVTLPARKLSGDFYDYFYLEDGRVFFCLGDVAGKGINAALMMSKTTSLFRCLGKRVNEPGKILAIINNEIHENIVHGLFVTMVAGLYDPLTRKVVLANAGHQPPLYVDEQQSIRRLEAASPPLGVVADIEFDEYHMALGNGALYIFSDGLTECWEQFQQPLGEVGVRRVISDYATVSPARRLHEIVDSVTRWKRETSNYLFDDITMLLLQDLHSVPDPV